MNDKNGGQNKNTAVKKKDAFLQVTENTELMEFLIKQLPNRSRNKIKLLLKNKQVLVDGMVVSQYNHPITPENKIEISKEKLPVEKKFREYEIVYEDHELIVIEKQAGLLSVATDHEKRATAYSMLSKHVKTQDKQNKIFIVHRLDRETSGLMLFAKNESIKHTLQETWTDTVIDRAYVALVEGVVEKPKGTITSYLIEDNIFKMHSSQDSDKGQKAITHYETIKKNRNYTLLKVNLETGRKNQIRVHMQDIGHCIVGDKKYGAKASPIKRLGLHAQQLSFIHPTSGKKLSFESTIPRAFLRLF